MDGFNPCAMWVLTVLLSLLVYARSRRRILLVGGLFVLTSGVIYLLFMVAWLNLFPLVGYVQILRLAVGFLAIGMGLVNIKDFLFFKKGFSLVIPEKAKPGLYKHMRSLVRSGELPATLAGTIVFAVTANFVELLCTAGFPMIYTRVLTLKSLPLIKYYFYIVLYNTIYIIPLGVVVIIFAFTMGRRRLTETQGKLIKLLGGAMMLTLGTLLILSPETLMLG